MEQLQIPEEIRENWQKIIEIMSDILDIPAVLINMIDKEDTSKIKVLQANSNNNNPFNNGDIFNIAGLYCEEVIDQNKKMIINNALNEEKWHSAPETDYNLISYLGYPILSPDNNIFGTICVMDIQERAFKKTEKELLYQFKQVIENSLNEITLKKKLKQSHHLIQSVLDSMSAHIAVLDKEGLIKYTNKAWQTFAAENDLAYQNCGVGVNYLEICEKAEGKDSRQADKAARGIKQVIKGRDKLYTLEYPCHSPDEKRWFNMRVTPYQGQGPYAAVIAHENITEKKLKEKELIFHSFNDQLTGLYNRRYFINEIERLNNSRVLPVSLIMGDLDNLKIINDKLGHKKGDDYLKIAAQLIEAAVRSEDIVARYGGDEFCVILPDTSLKTSRRIKERITNKFQKYNEHNSLPLPLNISLGCAVKENEAENLHDIFSEADKNMYINKGRNTRKNTSF